jgi:hypothetical protein
MIKICPVCGLAEVLPERKLLRCSRCKLVWYCSQKHQAEVFHVGCNATLILAWHQDSSRYSNVTICYSRHFSIGKRTRRAAVRERLVHNPQVDGSMFCWRTMCLRLSGHSCTQPAQTIATPTS